MREAEWDITQPKGVYGASIFRPNDTLDWIQIFSWIITWNCTTLSGIKPGTTELLTTAWNFHSFSFLFSRDSNPIPPTHQLCVLPTRP
jgi:hypothetical protein